MYKIFKINSKIRFVSIINLNGKIMVSEMRPELKSLLKNSNEEKFCGDIAIRRKMRHEFDKKLGKVSYVHVERENSDYYCVRKLGCNMIDMITSRGHRRHDSGVRNW